MATTDEMNVSEILAKIRFPFALKPLQTKCLVSMMKGDDVFGVLPTGYGKSLIYTVLPWLLKQKVGNEDFSVVLVVSPLISLMKDQVINIQQFGVECCYIGDNHSESVKKDLAEGNIPILLMSPESLFSGKWRDSLSSDIYRQKVTAIVVDEAHCVEQWGQEFRKDYSRLSELRSLLPKAQMLALTATATKETRKTIAKLLGMNEFVTVVGCCDRSNIMYFAKKASYDIKLTFKWLINELKSKGKEAEKSIIYCRNIKACSILYGLFRNELGTDNSYVGPQSAKNCIYAMYHHSTPEKNKRLVSKNFRKPDSNLRVVIATAAFGMGVNVPDVRKIIHWGAPRNFTSFMQESGRAGRDGNNSDSIVYFHPMDISKTATDSLMHSFCTLTTCRRQFLIHHFSPESVGESVKSVLHRCCDNCETCCRCGQCPTELEHVFLTADLDSLLVQSADKAEDISKPYRLFSDDQRRDLKRSLFELQQKCIENANCVPSLLPADFMIGLSEKVICDIVNNAHYIFDINDILTEYIFDSEMAESVLQLINAILDE